MNIVIAGGGKVGSELTSKLSSEGHEITLIDSNSDVLENIMEQYDVMAVQGNAASMETLEEAGIQKADLLIAATNADEVNLLSCFTGHAMNPRLHTIGRIRNPEYRDQAYKMRDQFGLNLAVNPEQHAAVEIGRLLKYPGFLNIDTFAKGKNEIVSLKVTAKSPLCDVVLNKLSHIIHCQVLICAVQREGKCIIPDGNFILKEGDVIYVTASADNLNLLLKNIGAINHKVKHVLIIGGSRIGYYLAKDLSNTDMKVSIIERDAKRCQELAEKLPNATILYGDASNYDYLESEHIENYDSVITLTGLDEVNIVISLQASMRNTPQIITKLSRSEHNHYLDSLSLGSIIVPKELSCNTIVRYVRAMQNKHGEALTIHRIANGQGEAIEFRVDENIKNTNVQLKDMKTKSNVLIVSISHDATSEIATGISSYDVGDTVVVVTNGTDKINSLNDIFEEDDA